MKESAALAIWVDNRDNGESAGNTMQSTIADDEFFYDQASLQSAKATVDALTNILPSDAQHQESIGQSPIVDDTSSDADFDQLAARFRQLPTSTLLFSADDAQWAIRFDVRVQRPCLLRGGQASFLPLDATLELRMRRDTTAHQVLDAFLKRFSVEDDARKFALYLVERKSVDRCAASNWLRLAECDLPLLVALRRQEEFSSGELHLAFAESECNSSSGSASTAFYKGIPWQLFQAPELCNFIVILEREQQHYRRRLIDKYSAMLRQCEAELERRQKHDEAMAHSES